MCNFTRNNFVGVSSTDSPGHKNRTSSSSSGRSQSRSNSPAAAAGAAGRVVVVVGGGGFIVPAQLRSLLSRSAWRL